MSKLETYVAKMLLQRVGLHSVHSEMKEHFECILLPSLAETSPDHLQGL